MSPARLQDSHPYLSWNRKHLALLTGIIFERLRERNKSRRPYLRRNDAKLKWLMSAISVLYSILSGHFRHTEQWNVRQIKVTLVRGIFLFHCLACQEEPGWQ